VEVVHNQKMKNEKEPEQGREKESKHDWGSRVRTAVFAVDDNAVLTRLFFRYDLTADHVFYPVLSRSDLGWPRISISTPSSHQLHHF